MAYHQSISALGETDPSRGWALHIPIFRYFNMLCDSGCSVSTRCETWSIAVWVLFGRTQPIRKRKNVWILLSPRNPLASNLNRTSRLVAQAFLLNTASLCTLEVIYSSEEYLRIQKSHDFVVLIPYLHQYADKVTRTGIPGSLPVL